MTVVDPRVGGPPGAGPGAAPAAEPGPPRWDRRRTTGPAVVALTLVAAAVGLTLLPGDGPPAREPAVEAPPPLRIVGVRPVDSPTSRPRSPVQDAGVAVTVLNEGADAAVVLEQRLDGGPPDAGPVDPVPPAGTAELTVRWRVLCDEIGGLGGPRQLVLWVRSGQGGAREERVPLPSYDDPTGPARQIRAAGVRACAVLLEQP